MATPLLKEGFGPTLVELLAPRWRRASPGRRRAFEILAVLLLALLAAVAILYPRDGWVVHHGRATSFNFRYPRALHRAAPHFGEYARLQGAGASFVVSPLHLPRYSGEVSGVEPLYAGAYISALAARTPDFLLQSEGKTRVNTTNGYTFTFAAGSGSGRRFTRIVLLTPGLVGSQDGVTMTMTIEPSAVDPTPDQVSVNDVLLEPLRSFRFGS
ncbi:MAG: hypothetical protein ACR2ND_15870 [Solirubrobacteraceae bacterium]